jgi:putative holliday junction resolvase
LGSVRVGLAISDELGVLAHPRAHLAGGDAERLITQLIAFAKAEGVDHFVVGLPRQLSGETGLAARKALVFAKQLALQSGLKVSMRDEWLTTVEAAQRLRDGAVRKGQTRSRIDSAAAAVLLQGFLDGERSGRTNAAQDK